MKRIKLLQKENWRLLGTIILIAVLFFGVWMFGWGCGSINVLDFSAEDVAYVQLSSWEWEFSYYGSPIIDDPEEIQALIDEVNAFKHTGSDAKLLLQLSFMAGGLCPRTYKFVLLNGDEYNAMFDPDDGEQPRSDMRLEYIIEFPDGTRDSSHTCRGSMEVFYSLFERHIQAINPPL